MAILYKQNIYDKSNILQCKRLIISIKDEESKNLFAAVSPTAVGFTPDKVAIIDNMDGSYTLETELIYKSKDGRTFVIPKGFKTDFGSIPRIFWIIPGFQPIGSKMDLGYILHDFCYEKHRLGQDVTRNRKDADDLLEEAGDIMEINWTVRHTIWSGVRIGGWWAWSHNSNTSIPQE